MRKAVGLGVTVSSSGHGIATDRQSNEAASPGTARWCRGTRPRQDGSLNVILDSAFLRAAGGLLAHVKVQQDVATMIGTISEQICTHWKAQPITAHTRRGHRSLHQCNGKLRLDKLL
jgi:small ligand-binding sensory domain FIST